MPVRKIKKNYRSVTGVFYSHKNNQHIAFESTLERDFFLLLEFDSMVDAYEEQPIELQYFYLNKKIRYTPDCIVHYINPNKPPCIYEIKYSDEIKDKKVFLKQKFDQIEQYLYDNDMDFKLFTELDIRTQRLENIKYLYKFASIDKNEAYIERIENLFKGEENLTFLELLKKCSEDKYEQATFTPYIWNMIYLRLLYVDMDQVITNNSVLRLNHGND